MLVPITEVILKSLADYRGFQICIEIKECEFCCLCMPQLKGSNTQFSVTFEYLKCCSRAAVFLRDESLNGTLLTWIFTEQLFMKICQGTSKILKKFCINVNTLKILYKAEQIQKTSLQLPVKQKSGIPTANSTAYLYR